MKGIVFLIVLAGLVAAGYFFYPQINDLLVSKGVLSPNSLEVTTDLDAPKIDSNGASTVTSVTQVRSSGKETPESGIGNASGKSASESSSSKAPRKKDRYELQYPLQDFKPIEVVVKNWNDVPKNALPKTVTMKTEVVLKLIRDGKAVGEVPVSAGTKVYVEGFKNPQVAVARAEGGSVKGSIAVGDTDFKEQISARYDQWKKQRMEETLLLRKRARETDLAAAKAAQNAAAAKAAQNAEASSTAKSTPEIGIQINGTVGSKKPNGAGKMDLMVASIERGEVPEIEMGRTYFWKWIGTEQFRGRTYETGVVGYQSDSAFGVINGEGKALIKGDRIVKWIYSGSEQDIPTKKGRYR